jgi:NADH:ubiquinone oxidoreductase subunit H
MAEYINIILISLFSSLIFMPFLPASFIKDFILIFYTLFFSFVFIWVRGSFPRFRYDQLIGLT